MKADLACLWSFSKLNKRRGVKTLIVFSWSEPQPLLWNHPLLCPKGHTIVTHPVPNELNHFTTLFCNSHFNLILTIEY